MCAMINRFLVLVCLVGVTGCLASDPMQEGTGFSDRQGMQKIKRQETRAPREIDRSILTARSFQEAPLLAQQVAKGSLPPISERLPDNPLVIVPVDTIGQYGGIIRRALTGDIVQTAGPSKTLNENLMGFSRPLPDSIVLGLAEKYEFL